MSASSTIRSLGRVVLVCFVSVQEATKQAPLRAGMALTRSLGGGSTGTVGVVDSGALLRWAD